MRRHTGQLYRCSNCSFATCNKSHLVEHIRTHARSKQPCRICSKKYTTEKSLVNHIRKYHKGENGKPQGFVNTAFVRAISQTIGLCSFLENYSHLVMQIIKEKFHFHNRSVGMDPEEDKTRMVCVFKQDILYLGLHKM